MNFILTLYFSVTFVLLMAVMIKDQFFGGKKMKEWENEKIRKGIR